VNATTPGAEPQRPIHFAAYGATNAACNETVPRTTPWSTGIGDWASSRFTVRWGLVTCRECLVHRPTPAREPHQREDEREALARAMFEKVETMMTWETVQVLARKPWTPEREVLNTYLAYAEAALAHLAERRAGDVEAVRDRVRDAVRTGATYDEDGPEYVECALHDDAIEDATNAVMEVLAAQIAALTPTRGVSAETHTEWGCRQRDGSVLPFDNWEDAAAWARGPWLSGFPPVVVRREVTDWREVRDAD